MAILAASMTSAASGLRPLDERRDLNAVADLVEICFSDALEPEGRRYIRDLRLNARAASFWQIMGVFYETGLNPFAGFVWEEGGRLVGNVSLFSFQTMGYPCYLIANVAVHPDFRGRGIGRALTSAGIDYARSHKAHAVWLHVRVDNDPAVHIYQSLGFLERARRTTWQARGSSLSYQMDTANRLAIAPRSALQWSQQKEWLKRIYPRELGWHLPVDWKAFDPGASGFLYRLMNLSFPRHWAVERGGVLQAILTWQRTIGFTDRLWLAIPETVDEASVKELLAFSRRQMPYKRIARLNTPTSLVSEAFIEAGFEVGHILLWMEHRLD